MIKRYSEILKGCWEISVGAGWMPIVERLVVAMDEESKKTGIKFQVIQVKQKFGELRYYYDSKEDVSESCDRIRKLVAEAELEASRTCENCGQPADLKQKKSGWLVTLCDNCFNEL